MFGPVLPATSLHVVSFCVFRNTCSSQLNDQPRPSASVHVYVASLNPSHVLWVLMFHVEKLFVFPEIFASSPTAGQLAEQNRALVYGSMQETNPSVLHCQGSARKETL
mmetsp:Transcript_11866/g.20622  ORF Transcript_11866/g.20622 Transcript_11866/m.20622 type:complete len:108 (-) Transcript_11866:586-909(-)